MYFCSNFGVRILYFIIQRLCHWVLPQIKKNLVSLLFQWWKKRSNLTNKNWHQIGLATVTSEFFQSISSRFRRKHGYFTKQQLNGILLSCWLFICFEFLEILLFSHWKSSQVYIHWWKKSIVILMPSNFGTCAWKSCHWRQPTCIILSHCWTFADW